MDKETVKKVATVARLHLEENEVEELAIELEKILEHFSKIKDLKTEDEMYYVQDIENEYRVDKERTVDEKNSEDIRKQFTKTEEKYLSAPKSIK